MKTITGVIAILYSSYLMLAVLETQAAQVFFQETDTGQVRPLTTAEKDRLKDPLFRIVLSRRPDVTNLSEIEGFIQPDPAQRRIFVVDEEITDSQQPQSRRAVIDFLGSNEGVQLGGNIMLSVFFNSSNFPEATDVEAWGWDKENGVYNFYKLDRAGNGSLSWKFRASSANADNLTVDQRAGNFLRCHTSGVPMMKELKLPWNNWHSFTSPADYLTKIAAARWSVADNARFLHLFGGDNLETTVRGAIVKFNNRKIEERVKANAQGGLVVDDARTLLRPLFGTTEINLTSANQPSGLHPLTPAAPSGPSQPIRIPDGFFLPDQILAGETSGGTQFVGLEFRKPKGLVRLPSFSPQNIRALSKPPNSRSGALVWECLRATHISLGSHRSLDLQHSTGSTV